VRGTASPDTGNYAGVHSPRLKAARRLNKRAFRQRERAFLAEGPQAVAEAFHCGAQVTDLFVTVPARSRHHDLVTAIAEGADPTPSFADGLRIQRVLAAVEASSTSRQWQEIPVSERQRVNQKAEQPRVHLNSERSEEIK